MPTCQVCFKIGHTAERCWHRYDKNYVPDFRHVAAAATNSYTIDTNWYTGTDATDHITGELEKLSLREKYHGGEQIHTTNGAGMDISHVGETIIHTQDRDLKLIIFSMFLKAQRVLFLFITLLLIIMCSLNFTLDSFLLRIGQRGGFFLKGDVTMVFTLSLYLSQDKLLESTKRLSIDGIVVSATLSSL
jgi:hypothetical protein